jgi:diguanylate cyclase (GGDEF)-like protein
VKKKEFKILAVDDQKTNLDVLIHILKDEYTVYPAKTGEAALKKAAEVNPDLILLDIILPDINGFEVLEILKSDDLTSHIPVIVLTGLSNAEDEQRGLRLGAADYIIKPFNSEAIKTRVKTQIRIVKQMRTIEKYSMIDEATDILNRKSFDRMLGIEWARAVREKNPVSLILIKAEGEKGDAALKVIPLVERRLKRATDIFARYNENVLAIILPNTPHSGAAKVADDIAFNIREAHGDTGFGFGIGMSSLLPGQGETVSLLVLEAERSLFKSKEE